MNEYLKTMMEFAGYGNPEGKYWFVGMEEALSIENPSDLKDYQQGIMCNTDEHNYSYYKKRFYKENSGSRYTAIYDIMGRIEMGSKGIIGELDSWLDSNQFRKGCDNFYTPLFPLGKARIRKPLPQISMDLFGLDTMSQYKEMVENHRFPFLRSVWAKNQDKVTICFGKGYWDYFKMAFGLESVKPESLEDGKILFFQEANTYLVPFFWYGNHGMGKHIEFLCKHIRKSSRVTSGQDCASDQ